ncbi:NACHT domain-containing protein [Massilia sp. BJB1822]|uniref:NACHT domain-containing protein n=1 Tax=Massilia sp. BJB1822 TaxID=2744470 RepID=UPI001593BEE9|nr:NACHT domain-containing protein [Massilia sp. BJB1822]NVE01459.1 NACHT domain-containing protein [Massilia sp. BJB1822]
MNSKSAGDKFRDYVSSILKSKFPDTHIEGKVAWKNADIVFSMMELGKRIKVAVECKNYSRSLNTTDFSKITSDYQTAIENNEINLLLIISNRQVESASRQFIEQSRNLRFMTLAELERWIVGLGPYVEELAEDFHSDEISKYYVEGKFESIKETALENLQIWLNSPMNDDTGLAVLGGYGLGKSSLAKRLASEQARRYLSDPENQRLPILIPLGQVVHETELAGLFGKHFTARHSLEGYSYKALIQLNSAGRLLIILDGFDEMKHAMTEHDFRSNFREFNKLRVPNAKILLLGRPNAFTSESSNLLIRGLSKIGGQFFSNSDFPAWTERKLSFFSIEEQRLFLDGFLVCKSSALSNKEIRTNRINEVIRDIDDDILQRPVQARIVGLLAADPSYTFKGTSRFRLYKDFVQQVIHRDQEKRARSFIPAADRHRFLCNLAWWSWTKPGVQGTFSREEVPNSLFDSLSNGLAIDLQAKRTEYLVSSLTEEKDSNFLYFAHRSFHEFLVASYITLIDHVSSETIKDLDQALNEETIDFLRESGEDDYLNPIYSALDKAENTLIGSALIDLLSSSSSIVDFITAKPISKISPIDVFIAWKSSQANSENEKFYFWLGRIIKSGTNPSADAAAFIFLEEVYEMPENSPMAAQLIARCWERMLVGINEDISSYYDDEHHFAIEFPISIIKYGKYSAIAEALRHQTRKIRLLRGDFILINAKEFHSTLSKTMKTFGLVNFSTSRSIKLFEMPYDLVSRNMNENDAKQFRAIFDRKGDDFLLMRGRRRARSKRRGEPKNDDCEIID